MKAVKMIVVLCLIFLGLPALVWEVALHSLSPGRTRAALVWQSCMGPDCSVRVEVKGGGWPIEIAHRSDAWLAFAHVAWSPDSSRAAIYVNLDYTADIRVGYDFLHRVMLDGKDVEPLLAESIVREYGLRPQELWAHGGDPLRWAESAEARVRYRERHDRASR
jgi:hypothetical protein